jgi:ABC-type lipoprotein export system ATPase subunit
MSLIELENVKKVYRIGEIEVFALNGVNLNIDHGEMVAIMGPSGSGKSTLMNILGCLDVPTSGSYRIEGDEVGSWGDSRLALPSPRSAWLTAPATNPQKCPAANSSAWASPER